MAADSPADCSISASCERSEARYDASVKLNGAINISVPRMVTEANPTTAPLSLVAVIDISYSMMGPRLKLAKQTLQFIIKNLTARDSFSVWTFGSSAHEVFKLSPMTHDNIASAKQKIEQIEVNGCTNLSAGLLQGINALRRSPSGNTNSVMLMTDGEANTGITTASALVEAMEQKCSQIGRDVSIFTFGYGKQHKASFLRSLSDAGNGMYYFIEKTDSIKVAFAECLGGVSSVALRFTSLEIIPLSPTKLGRVLCDLPEKKNGASTTLQIGDLSCGANRNIPFEFTVPTLKKSSGEDRVLEFVLSYSNLNGSGSVSCALVISRPKAEDCSNENSEDYVEIDEQRNRVLVAEGFKSAITLGEKGSLSTAKTNLTTLQETLKSSPSSHTAFTRSLIKDINEAIDLVSDRATFASVGVKYLYSLSRSHYQQRASGMSNSAASAYLTEGQKAMLESLGAIGSAPAESTSKTNKKSLPAKAKPQASAISTVVKPKVPSNRTTRGIRRLMSDFAEIKKHPLPSVVAIPLQTNMFEWHGNMKGPTGSPYADVAFHFMMEFPATYPFQPPKLFFCTYLKHEHVFKSWICLDMLQEFEWSSKSETDTPYTGWTTAYSVHSVLLQLQSFLFDKANTSVEEVKKAEIDAKKFHCKTCGHRAQSLVPTFPTSVANTNPFTSISIPSARVRTYDHKPRDIPNLARSTIVQQPSSTTSPISKDNENVQSTKEEEEEEEAWSVVESKSKKKTGRKTPVPTMRVRNTKVAAIQTSNRFIVKVAVPAIQIQEEEEEEEVEPVVSKAQTKLIKQEASQNAPAKKLKPEDQKRIAKCRKKNLKRREKVQRLKEEKKVAERRAAKALQAANDEETRRALEAAETKRKEEEQERERKRALIVPTSLEEALTLRKGSAKGLHHSLFIYLPEKVMKNIFSFFTVTDLLALGRCCRVFYRLTTGEELWKKLCLQYFPVYRGEAVDIDPKLVFGREVLAIKAQLFCFHSRTKFEDDVLGIPISIKRNPRTRKVQYISSTLDLLSKDAFHGDKVRKSVWKRPFTHWMPLYITPSHARRSSNELQEAIANLCDSRGGFKPWMVLDVFPKLMNTMVVSVMSGETHASIVALEGYCAFHHLLLKMIAKYPQLRTKADETIRRFISEERNRTKENCPSLGDFIPLLAISDTYTWNDVRSAYVQENFDRNALWVIKKYPGLRRPDKGYSGKGIVNKNRLDKSLDANKTSMRLLMFHVYFLTKIARPYGRSTSQVEANYDLFFGRPTQQMKEDLQQYCKEVINVKSWPGVFKKIGMKAPTQQSITFVLNQAVVNSSRKRYHN